MPKSKGKQVSTLLNWYLQAQLYSFTFIAIWYGLDWVWSYFFVAATDAADEIEF